MRIFAHGNWSNKDICPICKTNTDKKVILVGIEGTEEHNNIQAVQVHVDCLDNLRYNKNYNLIYIQC